jgi:hypothetical protein
MKIRIEDNSVRYRLRKSEVEVLAVEGSLKAAAIFPQGAFEYALQSNPGVSDLKASFSNGRMTVEIPAAWVQEWPGSSRVGFETHMQEGDAPLHLLIEKDFVCLDRDLSSQADQYPNPKMDHHSSKEKR